MADVLGRFGMFLRRFGTFWDVLRCIASLFSRQVQTFLKQSCQFTSYKSRQVQTRLNDHVNSCHTKLDKSKVGLGWPCPALAGLGLAGFWDVLGRFETF